MKIRKSNERGQVNHGWLKAKHSFSFGSYYDAAWTSFGELQVLNEDRIAPGRGFDMHSHKDMEIITILLSGQIKHRDNLGNEYTMQAGEVQAMTAGKGIVHSEWNPSETEETHLYQIWIRPERLGLEARYDQFIPEKDQEILVSKHAGGLYLSQEAEIKLIRRDVGEALEYDSVAKKTYVQVVDGEVEMMKTGEVLNAGDALLLDNESVVLEVKQKVKLLELGV